MRPTFRFFAVLLAFATLPAGAGEKSDTYFTQTFSWTNGVPGWSVNCRRDPFGDDRVCDLYVGIIGEDYGFTLFVNAGLTGPVTILLMPKEKARPKKILFRAGRGTPRELPITKFSMVDSLFKKTKTAQVSSTLKREEAFDLLKSIPAADKVYLRFLYESSESNDEMTPNAEAKEAVKAFFEHLNSGK